VIDLLRRWSDRLFSNEEVIILLLLLIGMFWVIWALGGALGPLLVSLVFAFLMQGLVNTLQRWKTPEWLAITLVFLLFLGLLFALIFLLMPLIWTQLSNLFGELPRMINRVQSLLADLPERYPQFITESQLQQAMTAASDQLRALGQWLLGHSVSTISNLLSLLIYLVLVPILVFFLLKDRSLLVNWVTRLLPRRRQLMTQVWHEMDVQISNYVRGKVIEIVVVGVVSYLAFSLLGLNYSALLGLLVGLSVIVPYVGAAVVTIPVALIGAFQWGWGSELFYLMLTYTIIQALDGNVLVPVLFSEVVNLHPVAIIVAVLFFGGLWGFWGIFFAIPLATLFKAVLNVWLEVSSPALIQSDTSAD